MNYIDYIILLFLFLIVLDFFIFRNPSVDKTVYIGCNYDNKKKDNKLKIIIIIILILLFVISIFYKLIVDYTSFDSLDVEGEINIIKNMF